MSENQNNTHRYFLKLSYNGKNYCGWQIQNNAATVQEEINKALSTLLKKEINVVGCGRTDTGVHAEEFFAHFDIDQLFSKNERILLLNKMNSFLPKDINFFDLIPVTLKAHARFDATSRTYDYRITRFKDPFSQDFTHYIYGPLNIKKMNQGANILKNHIDFTSFSKVNTQVKTNNCKIINALWTENEQIFKFTITADRFLRNMVRAIVGTLLDLGKDKISLDELSRIIESKNRSNAGLSVPAKGLFLTKVTYPSSIFIEE